MEAVALLLAEGADREVSRDRSILSGPFHSFSRLRKGLSSRSHEAGPKPIKFSLAFLLRLRQIPLDSDSL